MRLVFLAFVSSHVVQHRYLNNDALSTMTAEQLRLVLEVFVFQARGAARATLSATSMRLVWGVRVKLYLLRILLGAAIGVTSTLNALFMKSAPIITVFDAKPENV